MSSEVFLLHGVTGSGKTEVYLELARRVLQGDGRARRPAPTSVLLLVPEIALIPQLLGRCAAELPVRVVGYHSGLTPRQRQEIWEQCQSGSARVIVGTRSALFLPLQNLQLIIVDEEHDSSYKQEERFRYHARDLAIVRGRLQSIPVLLGSATPAIESLQHCRDGKYQYLQLPERAGGGRLPKLHFVDLARDHSDRNGSLISGELADAIDEVLQKREQCVLFLNRRGFSPILLCQDCGATLQCPHCQISLTLHKRDGVLLCHYCDYKQKEVRQCTSCQSSRVFWIGSGTERIEEDLRTRFPRARIARLDRDSTRKAGALEETLARMRRREIDILVGTQMLTKGHDYANVTLAGVLLAESSLNFPDFRAGERTFQLITQVAGRAGRGERPGRVLVQGFQANHYVMRAALDGDYAGLADRELASRRQLSYPPYTRLVHLLFRCPQQSRVIAAAGEVAALLHRSLKDYAAVLGPAPCPIEKLRSHYRWQILIKTRSFAAVRDRLQAHLDADLPNILPSNVKMVVDVDPLNML